MIAVRILTLALASLGVAHACECSDPTVLVAKQRATVVFRGTITALRPTGKRPAFDGDTGKIAVFRVSRVWKGEVGQTLEMPAAEEAGGCWGFAPQFLKLGAELIVYARRLAGMEYETNVCSRTQFVKYAAEDFKELGPGEEPKPPTPLRNPKSK
jgi:hypothetical protein